jgi:hypothetical protein
MQSSPDLLSLGAIIEVDDHRLAAIAAAARSVTNWNQVARRAEIEGVAPILYHHLKRAGFAGDEPGMKALGALYVRHRHATEIRISEFARVSSALAKEGIDSAALKGVALSGLIYPEPSLRPMRDIDFLIRTEQAQAARRVVETLGYRFDDDHPSRYMRLHHHLPNARKTVDGLNVCIEVHTSANSGDTPGINDMAALVEPLQDVTTDFGNYRTLGHIDMLNQLCRHALEPGSTIRLVSVMDIEGYCARFDDAIDWPKLSRHYRYIPNFLSLLDMVTPLPTSLSRFAYQGPAIDKAGQLIPTVSTVFSRPGKRLSAIMELVDPPAWWFRSYYGVGDRGEGRYRARMQHLYRLSIWARRRLLSSLALRSRNSEKVRRIG